jgi:rod shape-determining protein MreB
MDEAISSYVRRNHNLLIGEATAERIKQQVGIAKPPVDGDGPHRPHQGPRSRQRGPQGDHDQPAPDRGGLSEPVGTIVEGVRIALENTAPELAADIVDQGIVLTGGGALLQGLDEVLRDETGLPVTVADDPLTCVALGTGRALEEEIFRGVLQTA